MNTREIAAEYRLNHWAEIMRDCKASGLTVKAYCESAGFHPNVYYYWQRKLRETACRELSVQQAAGEKAMVPSGWAVYVPEKEHAGAPNAVTIEIGRCRVEATAESDPEVLARVCRMLISIC